MTPSASTSPGEIVERLILHFYGDRPLGEVMGLFEYPAQMISTETTLSASTPDEMEAILGDIRRNVREAGIRGVTCELRSVVYPASNMAVVSVRNSWVGEGSTSPGSHSATFVLIHSGENWQINSIGIADEQDQRTLMMRVEDLIRGLICI